MIDVQFYFENPHDDVFVFETWKIRIFMPRALCTRTRSQQKNRVKDYTCCYHNRLYSMLTRINYNGFTCIFSSKKATTSSKLNGSNC